MEWWEYLIDGVGIVCTIVSIISACKSVRYYNKSKHIMLLANAKVALAEMQSINMCMTQVLKLSNTNIPRGKNVASSLLQKGQEIITSIQEIKNNLSAIEATNFQSIIKSADFDCQAFINKFISGEMIEVRNNKECFKHDLDFEKCQECFEKAFQYLKECVEEHECKLT